MRSIRSSVALLLTVAVLGCAGPVEPSVTSAPPPRASPTASTVPPPTPTPLPSRTVHTTRGPVSTGVPLSLADLSGRIVFDDFENVFAMDVDGSNVTKVASNPAGSEFDGAWSPDGERVVYRDSTRGINDDDEIYIARADGSDPRDITNDPANDWGPDWSPDGTTIVFNSDRDGGRLRGYLTDPDGSNVRLLDIEGWVEYPSFSPDGTKIAYMGHEESDYEIFVADLATGARTRLTDSPGQDGWPAWSPDGTTIAFMSNRDDCRFAARDAECWVGGPDDEVHDIWLMDPDGSNRRRVTSETAQFVAWSPDSRYLLISGHALFVVRPDGTGRLELRAEGIPRALGGIPDWH